MSSKTQDLEVARLSNEITRIALTGKLRSGKSTVAWHLIGNYDFERVSFGTALKSYADEIFDHLTETITQPCPFGGEYTVGKRKPRWLYQKFGQLMREIDPDVWIKHAEDTVKMYERYRDTRGIVIDDLRQPNEYEWCRDNGYIIIRINADDGVRVERASVLRDDFDVDNLNHETEQYVDTFDVDYEIYNNGSLGELKAQVDEIMTKIYSVSSDSSFSNWNT